jgi:hypothetical protein
MSLRVGAHPLKLQWLARQVYDAFGHATNGEARTARKQTKEAAAKEELWLAVCSAMAIIKTANGRPTNHSIRRATTGLLLLNLAPWRLLLIKLQKTQFKVSC